MNRYHTGIYSISGWTADWWCLLTIVLQYFLKLRYHSLVIIFWANWWLLACLSSLKNLIQYKFFWKICILWTFLIHLRIFILLSFIVVILLILYLRVILNFSTSKLILNHPQIIRCFVIIIRLFSIRLHLNCTKLMFLLINNCIWWIII
jgi:hypothetical protein